MSVNKGRTVRFALPVAGASGWNIQNSVPGRFISAERVSIIAPILTTMLHYRGRYAFQGLLFCNTIMCLRLEQNAEDRCSSGVAARLRQAINDLGIYSLP
jgi:hypothetical protein